MTELPAVWEHDAKRVDWERRSLKAGVEGGWGSRESKGGELSWTRGDWKRVICHFSDGVSEMVCTLDAEQRAWR